jgi:hypothetical protein
MQLNLDLLDKWEHIIADVSKTDVPLECIKKVVIKLKGGKQKTVNVAMLRRNGVAFEDIEVILNTTFHDLEDAIRDVDFVVDISSVAELIQPETDKILGNL